MARPYKVPDAAAATRTLPPSATSRLPDPSTATSSSSSVCAFAAGPPPPAKPCCPTPTGVVSRPVRRLTARTRPPLSSRPTLMPAVSRSVKYTCPPAKLTPHPSLAKASPHRLTDTLLADAGPPTPPAIVDTVPADAAGPGARPAPAPARDSWDKTAWWRADSWAARTAPTAYPGATAPAVPARPAVVMTMPVVAADASPKRLLMIRASASSPRPAMRRIAPMTPTTILGPGAQPGQRLVRRRAIYESTSCSYVAPGPRPVDAGLSRPGSPG